MNSRLKLFHTFFFQPEDFYNRILEGHVNRWVASVLFFNMIITFVWELKIAIPIGDYEIYFSDNKFIDSFVSVLFGVVVFLILSILLHIFTIKITIKDKLEKSFLVVFSLMSVNILGIIIHASLYYSIGWFIKLHALFILIFLVQIAYLFIGLRVVFGISILRATVTLISLFLVTGVFVLTLLYPITLLISDKNVKAIIGEFSKEVSRLEVDAGSKILRTEDIFELRDKQQVRIESEIVWKISNEGVYSNTVGSLRLAEIRVLDVYKTVLKQNLLFHLYTEDEKLDNITGKKFTERIIVESNDTLLKNEFGLEIISLRINDIESGNM